MKKMWEVWLEGYVTNGERAGASYHGMHPGDTFEEACVTMMQAKGWDIERYYNPEQNTYWGCGFFDNGSDAVRAFG